MNDEKSKNLDLAISQIEKQYGKGSIMRLGNKDVLVPVNVIPTGSISIDAALGVGGFPRGRVIEVYGPESGGKTTLTLHVIAEAQRLGGQAAFIDAEHALDPSYARKLGVDVDNLLVSQPDNGEQALEIAEALIRSNAVDIIVVDSVAALVPRGTGRRYGRCADGLAGEANVASAAEAYGHRVEIEDLPDIHQPDS
jgi:recombination protein RecA